VRRWSPAILATRIDATRIDATRIALDCARVVAAMAVTGSSSRQGGRWSSARFRAGTDRTGRRPSCDGRRATRAHAALTSPTVAPPPRRRARSRRDRRGRERDRLRCRVRRARRRMHQRERRPRGVRHAPRDEPVRHLPRRAACPGGRARRAPPRARLQRPDRRAIGRLHLRVPPVPVRRAHGRGAPAVRHRRVQHVPRRRDRRSDAVAAVLHRARLRVLRRRARGGAAGGRSRARAVHRGDVRRQRALAGDVRRRPSGRDTGDRHAVALGVRLAIRPARRLPRAPQRSARRGRRPDPRLPQQPDRARVLREPGQRVPDRDRHRPDLAASVEDVAGATPICDGPRARPR
jgi:hypothetical protein